MRIEKINRIKIYDDVLDKQFLDYINDSIFSMKWMIHNSHSDQETPLFLMSAVISPDENVRKEEYIYLFNIIFSLIKNEPEFNSKNIKLNRAYVNLYPYGIGGDWHKDDEDTQSEHSTSTAATFLFYPSDWKEEYGGATEFQSGEKVEYKKNRLLIFDGSLFHRCAVHKNPHNRYCIAYKTIIE